MAHKKDTLAQRVKESYPKLSAVAASLNIASDKLGASITNLDAALKGLRLGISSWVRFGNRAHHDPLQYSCEEVGYAKLGGKWGLAIRTISGHEACPEDDNVESWPFNEAPRALRVRAVPQIPELLEQCIKDANNIIETIDERAEIVDGLTAAINDIEAGTKKTNVGQMMRQLSPSAKNSAPTAPLPPSGRNAQ